MSHRQRADCVLCRRGPQPIQMNYHLFSFGRQSRNIIILNARFHVMLLSSLVQRDSSPESIESKWLLADWLHQSNDETKSSNQFSLPKAGGRHIDTKRIETLRQALSSITIIIKSMHSYPFGNPFMDHYVVIISGLLILKS